MKMHYKIIQVVNVRWFNATSWYALHLSSLLQSVGHEVMVLSLEGTESFTKAQSMGLNPIGVNINTGNPLLWPGLLKKISNIVKKFNPDIINCHRGEGLIFWGLLRQAGYNFSLIRTRGDQRLPKSGFINRFLHNTMVDTIITTNTTSANAIEKIFSCPPDHVKIIRGGVDRNIFQYSEKGKIAFREQWKILPDEYVVGLLGRFDYVKGQRELLEAVSLIKQKIGEQKKIKLVLAGFPTSVSEDTVRSWITEYGMDENTILTGKISDVVSCISAMDLGVVASQGSEAIARAALEIMSCGIPLISTSIGVMPDLLPSWALVPVGNSSALAEMITTFLFDQNEREKLRIECYKTINTLSNENFLNESLDVYNNVISYKNKKTY